MAACDLCHEIIEITAQHNVRKEHNLVKSQSFFCHVGQDSTRDKSSKYYIYINFHQNGLLQIVIKALAHGSTVIRDCDSHKCDKETHER